MRRKRNSDLNERLLYPLLLASLITMHHLPILCAILERYNFPQESLSAVTEKWRYSPPKEHTVQCFRGNQQANELPYAVIGCSRR